MYYIFNLVYIKNKIIETKLFKNYSILGKLKWKDKMR